MIEYPLAVDAVMTRAIEAGSGPCEVLLLHGAGSRADRWRRNIDELAERGCRVVALDFPGHGFADKGPSIDCSVPAYARFTRSALDVLGMERPVIVGTSLGGHVAAMVALNEPSLCAGLVLVGTTGMFPHGEERRYRTAGRLRDTSAASITEKLHNLVNNAALITDQWIDEEHMVNNSPGAAHCLDALASYFEDRLDDDCIGAELADLVPTLPTLLVWGIQDAMVSIDVGRAASELLREAQLIEIDNAGHAPYFEQPRLFNTAVVDFITTLNQLETPRR